MEREGDQMVEKLEAIAQTFHIGAQLLHETVVNKSSPALVLRLEKWTPGVNDPQEGASCLIRAADGGVSFARFDAGRFVDARGSAVEEMGEFVTLPCSSPYGVLPSNESR